MGIEHICLCLLLQIIVVVCDNDKVYDYKPHYRSVASITFTIDTVLAHFTQLTTFIDPVTTLTSVTDFEKELESIRSITIDFSVLDPRAVSTTIPIDTDQLQLIILYPLLLLIRLPPNTSQTEYVVPLPIINNQISYCKQHEYSVLIKTKDAYRICWAPAYSLVSDSNTFQTGSGVRNREDFGGLLVCEYVVSEPEGIIVESDSVLGHIIIQPIQGYYQIFNALESHTGETINDYKLFTISKKSSQQEEITFIVPIAFNTRVRCSTFVSDRVALSVYPIDGLILVKHITFFFNLIHDNAKVTVLDITDLGLHEFGENLLGIILPKKVTEIKYIHPVVVGPDPPSFHSYACTINIEKQTMTMSVSYHLIPNYKRHTTYFKVYSDNDEVNQWSIGTPIISVGSTESRALKFIGILQLIRKHTLSLIHIHKYLSTVEVLIEASNVHKINYARQFIDSIIEKRESGITVTQNNHQALTNFFGKLSARAIPLTPLSKSLKELYALLIFITSRSPMETITQMLPMARIIKQYYF